MNKKRAQFIGVCVVLMFCFYSNLFSQDDKRLGTHAMIRDFDHIEKIIDAHPDPYTHLSEQDFKAKFEEVKSTLNEPHNTLDYYKKVATIVALLKDGHSSVHLPRFWMRTLRTKNGAFPYEVHLTNDDELFVIKNFNNGEIPLAAKIIAINGVSVNDFLASIDPYISYELKHFRNTIIDEDFEKYLYLAFGFADGTEMTYFTSDTASVKVKNMPYQDWKKFQKENRDEREIKIEFKEPYAYEKIADGVGLISIYEFYAKNLYTYDQFLAKTFKNIKMDSINSLIIDIRGNFGGWPKISSRLFHYISNSYFKTMARSSMKVSATYRNNFLNRNDYLRYNKHRLIFTTERHYVDMDALMNNPLDSYVHEDQFFNEEPITQEFEFKGDSYLLINRDSYSAASSFAATFQCYQMGTIVGEETGGTKIFRANAIYEELPRTGIGITMATTKEYNTCYDQELEGVKPTVYFTPTIFGLTSNLDTQLLFTLNVIKLKQKKQVSAN
ncbi:MAG TPA: S41 family peptidase [Cyclobacteriaceae bacterium]|mgnify:CR=1 FL=1|nr:hypothetical protein [Cyclobacteriaceae bacterium]HRK54633.1 S41 family peptidase [Cyclobacteriaceae bacterium]